MNFKQLTMLPNFDQFLVMYYYIFTRMFTVHCDNIRAACRTISGLTRDQLDLCHRVNDVTAVAISGLDMAVRECQNQVNNLT